VKTIRMFAFIAALLITAFIFRAIAHGFTAEEPIHTATGVVAHGAATSGGLQSAAD